MSDRRFTDKPILNPGAVRSLPPDHPAMTENRTLFPSTVVEVTKTVPEQLLVSGRNNKKIGATVEKGQFKGWDIVMLSLEERATCPVECSARAYCYGNGMQLARRHRIGDPDVFYDRLGEELAELAIEAESRGAGVLVRLHVLGDFVSTEYVAFWADVLNEWPNVAAYGYTHRSPTSEIGQAIGSVKASHPERFRIRWSSDEPEIDGAVVLDFVPDRPVHENVLTCPAQTDATACCATCAMCWSKDAVSKTIAFVKHGPRSAEAEFEHVTTSEQENAEPAADEEVVENARNIAGLGLGGLKPAEVAEGVPEFYLFPPEDLIVEASYQRELSPASLRLIRNIVEHWDWMHFKPPVLAEEDGAYFVIDGQHTAIAAATHPAITEIPCIVVSGRREEARAKAFVNQNTNRIAVTPYDIYHAELSGGYPEALAFERCIDSYGYSVPRRAPGRNGEAFTIEGVKAARSMFSADESRFASLLEIACAAEGATITAHLVRVWANLNEQAYWHPLDHDAIAQRLAMFDNFDVSSREYARETEQTRPRAGCILLTRQPDDG